MIYIPFWLNLYSIPEYYQNFLDYNLHSILVKSIHNRIRKETITDTNLHSILVKSILSKLATKMALVTIYIPFWLNLYSVLRFGGIYAP